ncbi:MAG: DUF6629 family protein [Gammaproteobacteria bacterium]
MCFSAEASFVSSGVLAIAGAATLQQIRNPEQRPFAYFPLIFSFHQFIEGCLWLSRSFDMPPELVAFWSHAFPFIAYVIWPVLVPYAIDRFEEIPSRRKLLLSCRTVGAGLAIFYLYYIVKGPVTVIFVNQSIHYEFYFSFWILSQWLYGFAIIGAAFCSSHKIVTLFGIGLVITYNIAKQFYLSSYPSVFCHLAAWLSLIIFLEIRYGERFRYRVRDPGSNASAPAFR